MATAGWAPDRAGDYCPRCGASAAGAAVTISGCPHCRGQRVWWNGVWRLGGYHAPLAGWIVDYKFHGQWVWGPWFGRRLAACAAGSRGDGPGIVTSVPLHWRRRMQRGYDQSSLIAREFARAMDLPCSPLLIRRRRTAEQSHIHAHQQRWDNVRRAFAMRPVDLTGWTVWLIDDVKTTGSTARACCRLLRHAGAKRINLVVAAVADPRGADFQRN